MTGARLPVAAGSDARSRAAGGTESETRLRILEEAARLFVAAGYHGLSMRELAERAALSKASLYYHFQDKESLFLAVLDSALERVERLFGDGAQETARTRVRRLLEGLLSWPAEQRALIRLASQEITHVAPPARERFEAEYRRRFVGRIETVMREGVASGELRELDPSAATWLLLGLLYPFTAGAYDSGSPRAREMADLALTLFFDGAARS